jgi:uncharacterized membrane protein
MSVVETMKVVLSNCYLLPLVLHEALSHMWILLNVRRAVGNIETAKPRIRLIRVLVQDQVNNIGFVFIYACSFLPSLITMFVFMESGMMATDKSELYQSDSNLVMDPNHYSDASAFGIAHTTGVI